MQIKTDEINNRIQININPNDYFIVKLEQGDDFNGDYVLSHRIDMSYCGKPDQIGSEKIYLDEKEYEKLKGLVDEII